MSDAAELARLQKVLEDLERQKAEKDRQRLDELSHLQSQLAEMELKSQKSKIASYQPGYASGISSGVSINPTQSNVNDQYIRASKAGTYLSAIPSASTAIPSVTASEFNRAQVRHMEMQGILGNQRQDLQAIQDERKQVHNEFMKAQVPRDSLLQKRQEIEQLKAANLLADKEKMKLVVEQSQHIESLKHQVNAATSSRTTNITKADLIKNNKAAADRNRLKMRGIFHFVLVVDCSGSMSGQKWSELTNAVEAFLQQRLLAEGSALDLVSIIAYDTAAYRDVFAQELTKVRNATYRGGGTSFSAALREAYAVFQESDNVDPDVRLRIPVLIFMSDGGANDGDAEMRAIHNLYKGGKRQLQSYFIAFGSDADENKLRQLSMAAGEEPPGKVIRDTAQMNLKEVFLSISQTIDNTKSISYA